MNLACYLLDGNAPWPIEPAPVKRDWMKSGFPYRCLPLTVANTAGWVIKSPCRVDVHWNGGDAPDDMAVYLDPADEKYADHILSHFGHGVVTFSFPFVFRTDEQISLRVAGLPNEPKYNCTPLEGLVESWWLPFTFTMNWRLQKPFIPVRFEKDEPICFIQPVSLDVIDNVQPQMKLLSENPELQQAYLRWHTARLAFNATNDDPKAWQKFYHTGGAGTVPPKEHRTQLTVKEFA